MANQDQTKQALEFVSREEHQAIMEKMIEVSDRIKVGHLPKDEELYLTRQLSDLLGFEVSVDVDNHRLPVTLGTAAALPHLRRYPLDTLAAHESCLEAQLGKVRSAFGWFAPGNELSSEAQRREQLMVSLPINFLPNWPTHYSELKQWYAWRKLCILNPIEQRAAIVCVGDIGPRNWLQHQFGVSPELNRWLRLWSPRSKGRAFVFFVSDVQQELELGLLDLRVQSPTTHA
jgi:hypothetical protein